MPIGVDTMVFDESPLDKVRRRYIEKKREEWNSFWNRTFVYGLLVLVLVIFSGNSWFILAIPVLLIYVLFCTVVNTLRWKKAEQHVNTVEQLLNYSSKNLLVLETFGISVEGLAIFTCADRIDRFGHWKKLHQLMKQYEKWQSKRLRTTDELEKINGNIRTALSGLGGDMKIFLEVYDQEETKRRARKNRFRRK